MTTADSILDRFRLDGRVAVVTGAGRGIGAATALAFAQAGADVVIGARSADQLDAVAAEVERVGRRAISVPGDLSTRDGLSILVDAAVDGFGGVDVVVNNVGGSMPQAFMDTSEKAFDGALRWNVTTAFNLTQLAVPHLLERSGANVVNIASTAGLFASRGFAAYGTAKAALIHLTRELAQDLAPKVRVNAVCPGSIATSALDIVLQTPELEQAMKDGTPLGRLGEAEEIAAAALYFASPAGAYTTGQWLGVDGGIQGSNLEMGIPDL
jgi:7-alpha-hydroxysteroid dehydrogenase